MSETAQDIIAKTEGMARIVVELGHLCSISRRHEAMFCCEVFQCDAARWLPDQQRYGHTFHVREAVTDQQIYSAHDPQFLYADAAYKVLRDVLSELRLWTQVENLWRESRQPA